MKSNESDQRENIYGLITQHVISTECLTKTNRFSSIAKFDLTLKFSESPYFFSLNIRIMKVTQGHIDCFLS